MSPLRHLASIVLLAAPAPIVAQEVPRTVEHRPTRAPAPRGEALLRAAVLESHNQERAALGIAPLVWDEALVGSARGYAEEMAKSGRFAHSVRPHGPGREGENLWRGSRGAYRYREMLGHWLAERANFVNAPTPNFSRTGRYQDVTHYAQIVWRATTRVGCAIAAGPADEYLVCRYAPSANVIGQRPY